MIQRMIGAARLDPATYEAVEADQNATSQALIIVLLAALAGGVVAVGVLGQGIGGVIAGIIAAIISYVLYAAIAYWVGTTFLRGPQTSATLGEVLRTLGFAQTPQLLLFLAFIPILGGLLGLAVAIWMILTTVVALRQALDVTTGRAVGIALVAVLLAIIPRALIGAIV